MVAIAVIRLMWQLLHPSIGQKFKIPFDKGHNADFFYAFLTWEMLVHFFYETFTSQPMQCNAALFLHYGHQGGAFILPLGQPMIIQRIIVISSALWIFLTRKGSNNQNLRQDHIIQSRDWSLIIQKRKAWEGNYPKFIFSKPIFQSFYSRSQTAIFNQ